MEKSFDVVALGELLIDFTSSGISNQGNSLMEANPGGAPCNVLSMLGKLNKKTAFIGKVGDDIWGNKLKEAIKEVNISSEGLILDSKINTTLAFVNTREDGDREFSFYRNPGADMMLMASEVNERLIRNAKVFHFGSLSMTHDTCREATKYAISVAKDSGCIITFDPNLREMLWDSLDEAHENISYGMSMCDVMKISDNEILWFTGKTDFDEAATDILNKYPNIRLLLLSLGKDGSMAFLRQKDKITKAFCEAFITDKTVETTGAGDTFCGCVINYILDHGFDLTEDELKNMLQFANKAASIITTRKGALRVMPEVCEILDF